MCTDKRGLCFFQHNLMVFIAELFWWFEVVRPDFVKPRDPREIKDGERLITNKLLYTIINMKWVPLGEKCCFHMFDSYRRWGWFFTIRLIVYNVYGAGAEASLYNQHKAEKLKYQTFWFVQYILFTTSFQMCCFIGWTFSIYSIYRKV